MSLLLKQIYNLIKLLNSDTGTNQIAAGFAAGFVLGMTPFLSLQSLLIFVCLFLFRIQIGAAFLSAFFFAFVAYILDPIFHIVGSAALEITSLQEVYTVFYNMPIIPFTRFNNSIVMGSGIASLALAPFIFILGRKLIVRYRIVVVDRFKETKLWRALKATSLIQWYYSYDKFFSK
ncbi:MAG: TIGR03546 family protein [Bdellovibrionales bacterium RBG_16_40_8]|nr:MAG: TIGR03546 family protein [Bdellovibrionales bacterium RBG_16_40_8]